jgi:hypothetical protein
MKFDSELLNSVRFRRFVERGGNVRQHACKWHCMYLQHSTVQTLHKVFVQNATLVFQSQDILCVCKNVK